MSLCLQQDDIASLSSKRRKSKGDVGLMDLDTTYSSLLLQDFALDSTRAALDVRGFGAHHTDKLALQTANIALAKKQQQGHSMDLDDDDPAENSGMPSRASQPPEPELVPLPLAIQGPAAVALKLLTDATCTEEHQDARCTCRQIHRPFAPQQPQSNLAWRRWGWKDLLAPQSCAASR